AVWSARDRHRGVRPRFAARPRARGPGVRRGRGCVASERRRQRRAPVRPRGPRVADPDYADGRDAARAHARVHGRGPRSAEALAGPAVRPQHPGRRAGDGARGILPHRVGRHPGEPLGHRARQPAHRRERAAPARSRGGRIARRPGERARGAPQRAAAAAHRPDPARAHGVRVAARRDRLDPRARDDRRRVDLRLHPGAARLPARDRRRQRRGRAPQRAGVRDGGGRRRRAGSDRGRRRRSLRGLRGAAALHHHRVSGAIARRDRTAARDGVCRRGGRPDPRTRHGDDVPPAHGSRGPAERGARRRRRARLCAQHAGQHRGRRAHRIRPGRDARHGSDPAHRSVHQLAFKQGWNATVSVWESGPGRTLKINGKADASDHGDMDTEILLGLAPAAARPGAARALVIGYGSGVTTRVLAGVPGMERVRVVEIEPAVLAMSRFFLHVNDTVLARSNVSVAVDDARSALQIDTARYDVMVSEPSNPWLAGVATLYTPEFFRIVRGRLADDGVFCQWVQLYQLPVSVVAGIVRNFTAVFPHVEIWFSSPGDVMLLGSARPLAYDPAWLGRLVGPHGALGELGREYLGVDQPADYFGHLLLGPTGIAELLKRPSVTHRDDLPRLEFVAARRFLDSRGTEGVFDSLVAMRAATQAADGASPFLFAKALTVRRGDPAALRYIDAARRAQPDEPRWTVNTAAILLGLGDSTLADTALGRLVHTGHDPGAWLLSGLVATRRGQDARAAALLSGALAAGADRAEARGGLAVVAAR